MAGVIQASVACPAIERETLSGLIYGTREPGRRCQAALKATVEGFADSQRETFDKHNLEVEYRSVVSGTDLPVVTMIVL
jgi:hypothetical protein